MTYDQVNESIEHAETLARGSGPSTYLWFVMAKAFLVVLFEISNNLRLIATKE